jgi:hypothetical protein
VRDYYACECDHIAPFADARSDHAVFVPALGHDKAQDIIDQITSAYESGGGPPPGGFGFGPAHLGAPPPGGGFGGPPMGFGGPPGGFGGGPPGGFGGPGFPRVFILLISLTICDGL